MVRKGSLAGIGGQLGGRAPEDSEQTHKEKNSGTEKGMTLFGATGTGSFLIQGPIEKKEPHKYSQDTSARPSKEDPHPDCPAPFPARQLSRHRQCLPCGRPALTWDVVDGDGQDEQRDPPPAAAAGRGRGPRSRRRDGGALGLVGGRRPLPLVRLAILALVCRKRETGRGRTVNRRKCFGRGQAAAGGGFQMGTGAAS